MGGSDRNATPQADPAAAIDPDEVCAVLAAAGCTPICAGCERKVTRRDFCFACNTFVCVNCDPHLESASLTKSQTEGR